MPASYLRANWRRAAYEQLERVRSPEDAAAFVAHFELLANATLSRHCHRPDFAIRMPLHLARPTRNGRVPEGYASYDEYLLSEHWQARRDRAVEQAGHRCENPECWALLWCWELDRTKRPLRPGEDWASWWSARPAPRPFVYDPRDPINAVREHNWDGWLLPPQHAIQIRLEVHHLSYDRLGCERPEDLIVLCETCHHLTHGIAAEPEPFQSLETIFARWRVAVEVRAAAEKS